MSDIHEILPSLAAYHASLTALAILLVSVLIQSVLLAPLAFVKGEQAPGMPLKGDHKDFSFRVIRTHGNSVENLPIIIGTLALAIVAGVSPEWTNWLVGLHVMFRFLFWAIYYAGTGIVAGGPRTLSFVGGWLTNMILAGMTVYSLIT